MSIEISSERPAYQEYAAKTMAKREYRLMTLAQRGLYITLRHELWVNESVPADPVLLGKILGFEASEIEAALPAVMPFFVVVGDSIVSPELDNYRAALNERLSRISEGASKGAAITNEKRWGNKGKKTNKEQRLAERSGGASPTLSPTASPGASPPGRGLSTVQTSPVQIKDLAVAPGMKVVGEGSNSDETDDARRAGGGGE